MAKILALDIGDKRIGVAVADEQTPFPAPLTTLEASETLAAEFKTLLERYKVSTVVIGYPRNQQGEATEQTKRVEHIVRLLKVPQTIPIIWQDESLTSVKAEDELKRRGKPYQKGDVDALAATYILNDYIANKPQQTVEAAAVAQTQSKEHSKKQAHKKSSKKRPVWLWLVGTALGLSLLSAVAAVGWYLSALQPRSDEPVFSVITVEEGSGTQQIATDLQKNEVIKSARAFSLYTRLSGVNTLQAGTYRLSSADSVPEIATIIADGATTTVQVLIPPGLRQDEIVNVLINEGYTEAQIASALEAVRDHPLLKGYPTEQPIEGFLYPDTYQIEPTTSVEQLLRTMLSTFQDNVSRDILSGLAEQELSLYQAAIIASIVQEEVPQPDEQKKVAQVFITRYKQGIALGADPTFKYAAARFGTVNNPSSSSPYNTRRFTGLPPTPIANFNLSALTAVANPSDTDYLYFVSGDDGTTYFSKTLEEHEANTAKYCTVLCR